MEKKVVDIFDISYEGSGVGKLDEKIIFVPKTLVGESVSVEQVKQTSSFTLGKVIDIIKKSDRRIDARCPYFSICGGCDFQHCDYETEKEYKMQILKKELKKIGFEKEIFFYESKKRFEYRNKLKLDVKDKKLGYYKSKSHEFFEVKSCPIATQKINEMLPIVLEFVKCNSFKNLKSVYFKQVGEVVSLCFLFSYFDKKILQNVKKMEIFQEKSVFFAYGEVLENNKTEVVLVKKGVKLNRLISDKLFEFNIAGFNQVNDFIAEKLYQKIEKLTIDKRVVNAYSGQGFLTYLIAQKAKFVYGIEYQKAAHEVAERLKEECENYKFDNICGKVEDCLGDILCRDRIDVLVLDPAREGCKKEVLNEILKSDINEILYVSCKFSTLVRDLKILQEKYNICEVEIFDMFPCTAIMETFVILRQK